MNQNTPSTTEPDEVDELLEELLKWQKVIFNIWDNAIGRKAQERELASAQEKVSYLEAMAERQRSQCQDPARCDSHRCRRRRRCGRSERVAAMVAAARADVAARRARLQREFAAEPPPSSPAARAPAVQHRRRMHGA